MCRICWSADALDDIVLSGSKDVHNTAPSMCCGYGVDGRGMDGYDCLQIPGAALPDSTPVKNNERCGGQLSTTTCARARTSCRRRAFPLNSDPTTYCCQYLNASKVD